MGFVRFAKTEEIPEGRNKSVRIGLRRIAVFNIAGTLYAIEDACAHMKAPLSQGRLSGTELTCTWHGWQYDIRTGQRKGKEAGCVRTFPVKIESGVILVDPAVAEPEFDEAGAAQEDELPPLIQ